VAASPASVETIEFLQESDATRCLILEFVEGDTLADILKKRGTGGSARERNYPPGPQEK